MTPAAIIEQVAEDGVHLALSADGRIKASGKEGAVTRWLPIIRECKPGIVAALQSAENVTIQPVAAVEMSPYTLGDRITWQVGAGGKVKEGVVDFFHAYPGEVWTFCTLSGGGWTAVNAKYIRKI